MGKSNINKLSNLDPGDTLEIREVFINEAVGGAVVHSTMPS